MSFFCSITKQNIAGKIILFFKFFFFENKIPKFILDQRKILGFVLKWFNTFKIFYETFVFKKINFKIKYNFKTRNGIFLFDYVKSKFSINFKNIATSFDWNYYLNQVHR